MDRKSLHVNVPDTSPFDLADWFPSFVGREMVPFVRKHAPKRFWWSQYGGGGSSKSARFRFEIADSATAKSDIDALIKRFGLAADGYSAYDVAADLGRGENSRFLGSASTSNPTQRGEAAFDFLHAGAKLMIDHLVGPDKDGRYSLETDRLGGCDASGFNLKARLESHHHLFCNMTDVPISLVIATHPSLGNLPMTYLEFILRNRADAQWAMSGKPRDSEL